jgi:AcrR family transcriptional regulator
VKQRSSRVRPLRERLREQTDAAILDAAEHVLAQHGLTGASMQAIAREAGVAVGTLYNRFDDRDGLLRSLVEERRAQLASALAQLTDESIEAPFPARLLHFVTGVLRAFDERKTLVRAMLETELWRYGRRRGGPPVVYEQLLAKARSLVEAGVREGVLRSDAPELTGLLLGSGLRGLMIERARSEDPAPVERDARAMVELFLRGAGVPA